MNSARRFYYNYTKDFNFKDVEQLFKQDMPGTYDFYVKRMKMPPGGRQTFKGKLLFLRNLFLEFLMQLSPPRRIVYTAALIIFILSFINNDWQWAVFSFILVNLLIAFELADKLTARGELEVARDIQAGMMPQQPPVHQHFEICGYSESAQEVGGDYFDFIHDESDHQKLYLVIGDISGKGMAAALHMVQVRTLIHNLIINHSSPQKILVELNRHLKKFFHAGTFFTVSMAEINSDKNLNFCRAGHLPLLHYSRKKEKCYTIIPRGIGIGLVNHNLFNNTLEQVSMSTQSGDILIFYTDGIVETMNEYMREFGEERLKHVIESNAYKTADGIKEAIIHAVKSFSGSAPKHDDLTFIIMKVK